MPNTPKVAICQSSIILGGRLRVIIDIVEILNQFGIVPDIITSRLFFKPEQIEDKYGKKIQVKYRFVPRVPKFPPELTIVLFNAMLKYYASTYDLLINTNNSLIFLPENKKILTYMFYPRKGRIMAEVADIHQPEIHPPLWSRTTIQRPILRQIYHLSKPKPNHKIICMTKFTCSVLKQEYDIPINLPIIYPPVNTAAFLTKHINRNRAVVTMGRFSVSKRQIEQIKLAQTLPHIPFHIIGFANNNTYYQQCQRYVEKHKIDNVHLHPDASFTDILNLLQSSKYFLHTLINEPFGITAVQATAAGCIPIVHNSGGQQEAIPNSRLRYQNLDEVPDILNYLETLDSGATELLAQQLQDHIVSHFDEKIFQQKMKQELELLLGANLPKDKDSDLIT